MLFQKRLDKSKGSKPSKIWADKGSEFYNISFKKWSKDNDIDMYSIHDEGKSVIAGRFIRTLKNKIYKYMTSISNYLYINKLDDIVDEHNNTYHRTIRLSLLMLKITNILILKKKLMIDILNLKLVIR